MFLESPEDEALIAPARPYPNNIEEYQREINEVFYHVLEPISETDLVFLMPDYDETIEFYIPPKEVPTGEFWFPNNLNKVKTKWIGYLEVFCVDSTDTDKIHYFLRAELISKLKGKRKINKQTADLVWTPAKDFRNRPSPVSFTKI